MTNSSEQTDHNNINTVYEYTESFLQNLDKSIDSADRKLTTVIGFSGVLLRFANDLSGDGWLLYLKIGVCVFLVIAIILAGLGLTPKDCGLVVDPDELLETERYYDSEELCKLRIARAWRDTANELDQYLTSKTKFAAMSIRSLLWAAVLFAIEVILREIIPKIS
jgi:hypothetical protein